MSARCRTPRSRRDSWFGEGCIARCRAEAAAGRDAIAEVLVALPRLAVGGEEEWTECEARWFAEMANCRAASSGAKRSAR